MEKSDLENLNKLKSLIDTWRASNEEFFKLSNEKNFEKMNEIALNSGRTAQTNVLNAIDEIIKHQKQDSAQLVSEALKEGDAAKMQMMIAIALGFVISIGLGFLLTRSITKPLKACVSFAGHVSEGKLDEHLDIDSKDETGILSTSLNQLVEALKDKIAEANDKSSQAQIESENAKIATQEARAAKEQAERAKAEGMLQAAHQLEGVVEVVTSASEELSAQIEQSSRGSAEQSHRVSETATAMDEMNATVLEGGSATGSAQALGGTRKLGLTQR